MIAVSLNMGFSFVALGRDDFYPKKLIGKGVCVTKTALFGRNFSTMRAFEKVSKLLALRS
jgi:hypothetical protein